MPVAESSISLSARSEEIPRLAEWVSSFCQRSSLADTVEFQLNLVLEELVTNSISHGQASSVDVTLRLNGAEIAVVITDDGVAFDPTTAPGADLTSDIMERKIGGLGIHLVRRMVQDLACERRGDHNRLSFRMATG